MRRAVVLVMLLTVALWLVPAQCQACCAMHRAKADGCCAGETAAVRGLCCPQLTAPALRARGSGTLARAAAGQTQPGVVEPEMKVVSGASSGSRLAMQDRPRPPHVLRV